MQFSFYVFPLVNLEYDCINYLLRKWSVKVIEKFKIEINEKIYNLNLKRKISNKHTYLRIKSKDLLEISSHIFFTKKDAVNLVNKQEKWIEKKVKIFLQEEENKDTYLLYGKRYEKQNLSLEDIENIYRNETKKLIPILVEKFSGIMKLYPSSIKYRKNKRTWGSCNYKNGLNFNILLTQFPIEVIEYVVIHELAHIKHKNHSKAFWKLVQKYCNDYKQREKLLKSFL
ncbi:M48 family metallopeptidase [Halarcobacter mediterraneus]|uniref:M48 family metallopeptidase n=1 Tax=Halarcobacter mediterraneus TaxID=2023153 RepID=UPI001E35873C|nr:SprT family zinc-dependent metalloprotease [Halarcobacter mediterraneus]